MSLNPSLSEDTDPEPVALSSETIADKTFLNLVEATIGKSRNNHNNIKMGKFWGVQ